MELQLLTHQTPPKVAAYPRCEPGADHNALAFQVGHEVHVVRWKNSDAPQDVARRLRQLADWIERR